LPLFLSLIADVASDDPALAKAALLGLSRYQQAPPGPERKKQPVIATVGGATLQDLGGDGPSLLLVPSLINRPDILDLDEKRSLARTLAARHRVLLLDWGPARDRSELDLAGHVDEILLPLLASQGHVVLIGYCLGGTLALRAASRSGKIVALATLASPWRFAGYPPEAKRQFADLWALSKDAARALGGLPMEVLQSAFWALDPRRIVEKFARFGQMHEGSAEALGFVMLEDWANSGESLPCPAARELVVDLFEMDSWQKLPMPACPMLHATASNDRIVPAESAAPGLRLACAAGHVGMVVGRYAPALLHAPLLSWLEGVGRGR
jgi:polyhydroxyalkanoate synthase